MNDLASLYRETIRRHAAQPVGLGADIRATHRHELFNPQCGDRVDVRLRLRGETIEEAAFDGEGCAICMASASLLCQHLPGAGRAEAGRLHELLQDLVTGRIEPGDAGPLAPLAGVRPFPSRAQCATLPWRAAAQALASDPPDA